MTILTVAEAEAKFGVDVEVKVDVNTLLTRTTDPTPDFPHIGRLQRTRPNRPNRRTRHPRRRRRTHPRIHTPTPAITTPTRRPHPQFPPLPLPFGEQHPRPTTNLLCRGMPLSGPAGDRWTETVGAAVRAGNPAGAAGRVRAA